MEKYTIKEVSNKFGDILEENNRVYLMKALSSLDKEIVDKIAEEVLFTDSRDGYAYHIPLNSRYLKERKSIIFLSYYLKEKTEEDAIKIILHEIAHYYLNHKTLFDFPLDEIDKFYMQDKEADKQVEEWLKK